MKYIYALSLAYLKPNNLLLLNNEIMKGMFVKKNISAYVQPILLDILLRGQGVGAVEG